MYGKIFQDIHKSTLMVAGGWLPTYIFEQMIVIADKDGFVEHAPLALYREIGLAYETDICPAIPLKQFEKAIAYLEAPDPESRSPECDGRRILPLKDIEEYEWNRGWLIVNYEYYRQKASKTEPKGASAIRMRRLREKKKGSQEIQSLSTQCDGDVTVGDGHTDTDTDIDIKETREFKFAEKFYERVLLVYPKTKKPNLSKWAQTIERTCRLDNRTIEELWDVFVWANKNDFWATNIMSPDKLRKQFDRLAAEKQHESTKPQKFDPNERQAPSRKAL